MITERSGGPISAQEHYIQQQHGQNGLTVFCSMVLSLVEGEAPPNARCQRIGPALLFERLWHEVGCRASSGVHRSTHMLGVPPKSSSGATNLCVMSRLTKRATPGIFQTGVAEAYRARSAGLKSQSHALRRQGCCSGAVLRRAAAALRQGGGFSMRVSRVLAFVSGGRAPVVRQRMGSSAHAGLC